MSSSPTESPTAASADPTQSKHYKADPNKKKAEFRNYVDSDRQAKVQAFYQEQHSKMTYDFVCEMEKKYLGLNHFEMGIWEALEYLDSLVDDSDPDIDLSQMQHGLQTAEAIREKYPGEEYDWFHLTGLIHDIGKILSISCKEPQWCVVGDTFPVGCHFESSNVFSEAFAENPDSKHPVYSTELGVYKPNCGLDNVKMSWGHDEYLYRVCVNNKCKLPPQALAMIRFHSFYPWHRQNGYQHLINENDKKMLEHVLMFNQFDLYSKAHGNKDVAALKPYYQGLIKKYFPDVLKW